MGVRLKLVRVGPEEAFGQSGVLMVGCRSEHTAVAEEAGLWWWGWGVSACWGKTTRRAGWCRRRWSLRGWTGPRSCPPPAEVTDWATVTEHSALYTWGNRTCTDEQMKVPTGQGQGHDDKRVPALVAPLHQLGDRVGRCLPLLTLYVLDFAMGRAEGSEQGRRGRQSGAGGCRGGWRGRSQVMAGVART